MNATIFDDRTCILGEGPLWHPLRGQLFWFDIMGRKLHTRTARGAQSWALDELSSAAGWIDADTLLIATERRLATFDIETGATKTVAPLEADNPVTRSNDGRADPWGGFWIGTMGKNAETGAGAIYRYYRGEVRKLFPEISIPNSICFAPEGKCAYFTDTVTGKIMRSELDAETGWPSGTPEVFLDLTADGLNPDGAVTDAEGSIWVAQWGASRVAAYGAGGRLIKTVGVDAPQPSCPAFGGPDFSTLYVTTARENLDAATIAKHPSSGMVFMALDAGRGRAEPQVVL